MKTYSLVRAIIPTALIWLAFQHAADAQLPEPGEWQMFGAQVPTNLDRSEGWAHRFWIAPVWFYNTRTGTVYRVIGWNDELSRGCGSDDVVAPCISEGLVPVPLAALDSATDTVNVVEREPEPGDWRMFARAASVQNIEYQANNYGAWLYNAYSGAVYEVHAECNDDDFSALAGCMVRVPVRDTYNLPASLNPHASGILQ